VGHRDLLVTYLIPRTYRLAPDTRKRLPQSGFVQTGFWVSASPPNGVTIRDVVVAKAVLRTLGCAGLSQKNCGIFVAALFNAPPQKPTNQTLWFSHPCAHSLVL
jgi:hypothetical protein